MGPLGQLTFRPQMLGSHPEPTLHGASTHHRHLGIRSLHQLVRFPRISSDEHATLATGRDGHVPADQEGQAPEHLLLRQKRLSLQQLAKSLSQLLVVRHASMVQAPESSYAPE